MALRQAAQTGHVQVGHVQYVDPHTGAVRQFFPAHGLAAPVATSVKIQTGMYRYVVSSGACFRSPAGAPPPVTAAKQVLACTSPLPRRVVAAAPTGGNAAPLPERDVRDVLSATCRPADAPAPLALRHRRCTAPEHQLRQPLQQQQLPQQMQLASPRPTVLNQLDCSAPVFSLSDMKVAANRGRLSVAHAPFYGTENISPNVHHNELGGLSKSQKEPLKRSMQQEPVGPRHAWQEIRQEAAKCTGLAAQEASLQRPGWKEPTPLRRSPLRPRAALEPVLHLSPQAKPLAENRVRPGRFSVNVMATDHAQVPRSPPVELRRPVPESAPTGSSRTPVAIPTLWRDTFDLGPEGHPIGCGAFADVFRVINRRTFRSCAIKVMHRPNFTMRGIERQLDCEIEAMRAAATFEDSITVEGEGHHIVRLINYTEENNFVYLMLDFCKEGDLLRRLQYEPFQRCAEQQTAIWARQLFLGLRTVHALGFLHRDIKPDNLLLASGSRLKIGDFGWCCYASDRPTSLAGTFLYMAPEVLQNKPQNFQVDVWSAGVTFFQVLLGRQLLNADLTTGVSEQDPHRATALKQAKLVQEIFETCPPRVEHRPQDLSTHCWDFLRRALEPEPTDRMTVDQALEHHWLRFTVA